MWRRKDGRRGRRLNVQIRERRRRKKTRRSKEER